MKVKELITMLEKQNADSEVQIGTEGYTANNIRVEQASNGKILICDCCYYNDVDSIEARNGTRTFYEVMSTDGTISEQFDFEDIAIDYAEKVFLDEASDPDFEVNVYRVTEKLDDSGEWQLEDDIIIASYDRKEAYEEEE